LPNCGPLPQTSQRFAMMTDLLLAYDATVWIAAIN